MYVNTVYCQIIPNPPAYPYFRWWLTSNQKSIGWRISRPANITVDTNSETWLTLSTCTHYIWLQYAQYSFAPLCKNIFFQFNTLHNGIAWQIMFSLNLLNKRDGAFHDCFYRRTKSNLSLQTLKSWERQLTYMYRKQKKVTSLTKLNEKNLIYLQEIYTSIFH